MKKCNEILGRTLRLTETMVELADLGDEAREDVGCGVLYGLLRDSAFKIRKAAEQEREAHISKGWWPQESKSVKGNSAGESSGRLQSNPNRILRRRSK
jgi:hypothetical protein